MLAGGISCHSLRLFFAFVSLVALGVQESLFLNLQVKHSNQLQMDEAIPSKQDWRRPLRNGTGTTSIFLITVARPDHLSCAVTGDQGNL
ncbi:hypothetical protein ASPCADRAFT_204122 [Aspergillus carbonarius ITEM 5010]|uniref:Uncharacterized protein n=1 Tax=Aspergillus carbonarius (strain ITEM 5010) TaxID=602072 RepID=A0A1R3S0E7_ASPC5|nr:hypothetical protein ASPCADRAFT_204122 [Aspergillus carbonarius ITEM 5010]